LRYNPSPDTLLKEIKKVHPGHYLLFEFENGISVSSRPYTNWRPPVDISESGKKNPFDTYTQKIENAVARQLLSDVDIGVLLSGGVDSAVVAALASKHYGKRLKAFTIGFEEVHFEDEIHDAAYTASFLGIDHYYRRISFTEFLTHIRTCTEIVEEPLATTSIIPMYYLAELASEHVKVVLTGQGADEPLGGYRKYKLEMLRTVIPPPLRKVVSGLATMAGGRNEAFRRGSSALSIGRIATLNLSGKSLKGSMLALCTQALISRISGFVRVRPRGSDLNQNNLYYVTCLKLFPGAQGL
jgi:asparagine synthase (glutamine-hydrolysing)